MPHEIANIAGPLAIPKPWDTDMERRQEPRFTLHMAYTVIPLLADGSPDVEHRMPGYALDISSKGIGLELLTAADLPASAVMVVFQSGLPARQCIGLEVVQTIRKGPNCLHIGGRFGGLAQRIVEVANQEPILSPQTLQYARELPDEVLDHWADLGVLESMVLDRVLVCPKCHGLPTFRQGCRRCGSARVKSDQLVQHFACAYVGPVEEFEKNGTMVCPKCRARSLVIGADYECLNGPYRCEDCGWGDTELELVGQCLSCSFRFPKEQAHEREMRGYRAHRLDPLALITSS